MLEATGKSSEGNSSITRFMYGMIILVIEQKLVGKVRI